MAEDQAGPVTVTDGVPVTVPNGTGQGAQSQTAAPTEPAQVTPKPNWDDESNPYLQRWRTQEGIVKSAQTRQRQLEERLNQVEADRAERDAQAARDAETARLKSLVADDDGPLAREMKRRIELEEAERQWQQKHLPGAYQRAAREVYASYQQGFGRAAQKYGLTNEELAQLGQEHPQFDDFMDAVLERSVAKKLGSQNQDVEAQVQARVTDALKAHETRSAAERRAASPALDTTVAAPVSTGASEDASFWTEFARRKTGDRKSAEALVNRALR